MALLSAITKQAFELQATQEGPKSEALQPGSIAQSNSEPSMGVPEGLSLVESGSSQDESDEVAQSDDLTIEEEYDATACPFCPHTSLPSTMTLQHLFDRHALTIPCIDRLTDLATFLGYLNTIVHRFHECIYCARRYHSAAAVRQHIVMKGHCRLDLSAESDLLDFWELEDGQVLVDTALDDQADVIREKIRRLAQAEMILPSGAVVMPRTARSSKKHSKRRPLQKMLPTADSAVPRTDSVRSSGLDEQGTLTPGTAPSSERAARPQTQALARRNEMGLTGVNDHQRQALRIVERKMIKQESLTKARYQWTIEKEGNRQKTFRPDNPGGRKNG